MSFNSEKEDINEIMTTWHDNDTDDEVADFFLNSTNISNGLLVAFFDEKSAEDRRLKTAILNII